MNTNDWFFLVIGVLIGLGIGYFFLWGQPYSELNNKYINLQNNYRLLNENYNKLNQDYLQLRADYDLLKKDTKQLLVEYVTQETLWQISGLEKYRRLIEVLGILIKH